MPARTFIAAALAASLSLTGGVGAVCAQESAASAEEERFRVDVQDEPLLEMTIVFSRITGENFVLLDQDMAEKRISIYAPEPVTRAELRELFVTALRLHGLVVSRADAYWKIESY